MKSQIIVGKVVHTRMTPIRHHFSYPMYYLRLELDELPALAKKIPFFGYNAKNLIAIHDADYLTAGDESIRSKLVGYLKKEGIGDDISKITLITCPRFLNYVFNPVSFFFCYRSNGSLRAVVAEVNNTFGERHLYLLPSEKMEAGRNDETLAMHDKEFHVSPFYDLDGEYQFKFRLSGEDVDIHVNTLRDGKPDFYSRLFGKTLPFTAKDFLATFARYPLAIVLTVPRITWQAGKLFFIRRLKVYKKPVPASRHTIGKAPASILEKLALKLVCRHLQKIKIGQLSLILPNGEELQFGDKSSSFKQRIDVKDYRFFTRSLFSGDIGFGESFTDGEWTSTDLTGVISLFIQNLKHLDDRKILFSYLGRFINQLGFWRMKNSIRGSRKNIHAHYDLGNDLFQSFLDETMMYSSAIFDSPEEDLESAQKRKLSALIEKAQISPNDHVLEIGTGWGGFAIEAVRQTNCKVTTITISEQQFELAKARVKKAGLEDKITIILKDYREMEGEFDKIVSIEMLEAVGKEFLGTFFKKCDELLKPHGIVVLQVITLPDQRIPAYSISGDWIQKHIFPGGFLPSLTLLSDAMTKHSSFFVEGLENIGIHYATTLQKWREAFLESFSSLPGERYDERFKRAWLYYFAYCEAGFLERAINNLHLTLTREGNKNILPKLQRKKASNLHAA